MPKKYKTPFRDLGILVNGAYATGERDAEALGGAIGLCRATTYKYLKNPEMLPLDKLIKLCRELNITIEEFKECF